MKPDQAWQPYTPSAENPWDLAKVGHLYRRAGFGPTMAELERGLADGPEKTIQRLLTGQPADPDFEAASEFMADERSLPAGSDATQLAAWWLARILHNPHPFREKLALFWHNHFATSLAKVRNARFMLGQYRLLYEHALGDFRQLLKAITTDPAMMIWLDTVTSRKGQPNENYARELMELFSLGIGHYTETDIREAARAFTGYTIRDGVAHFDPKQHDAGEKTVLGQTGRWKAEDIVRICLEQPACPRFIVGKLYRAFVSEAEPPTPEFLEPLAQLYRRCGFNTATVIETIFRSQWFFSPAAYRQRIKSPVEFVVGIVRGLEGRVGTLPLADALAALGQLLFSPPSVKGWDGGPAWLNAQTLLYRQNLALAITSTEDSRFGRRCDPAALLQKHLRNGDAEAIDFFLTLFLQNYLPAESLQKLRDYAVSSRQHRFPKYWTESDIREHRWRTLAYLTLTIPEFQLA